MRILLATDHYPPFIGGAQRQAQLLAEGMVDRGHEVTVVTPWSGGLPRVDLEHGVPVHRVKQLRTALPWLVRDRRQRYQPPYPDPVTIWSVRRLIAAAPPDLIHTYGWLSSSVAAALGRRRIPMLLTARDYASFCATRTLVYKGALCSGPAPLKCMGCAGDYYGVPKGWVAAAGVGVSRPLLVRKTTAVHGVSTFVTEAHRRFLLRADPGDADENGQALAITVPDMRAKVRGEDTSPTNPEVAAVLSQLPDQPFMLFVGAFRRIKGLETIFAAYRRLSSPPPLVFMGTFEWDAPRDFPEEALVLTEVPHAAVMAAWDRALFAVLPSIWPEPLAGTVHEAMSRGKAVIGTRIGGTTDMVDETTGILVPPGDDAALAAAMEDLIRDPERREAYGRAAAERAKDFTLETVLPRYEQLYRDVIAAAAGTPAG
jgi:glycosyltransferase involved in cell wall biosynthesis